MLGRIIGQVPVWARRDHPLLRYELGKSPKPRTSVRYARAFGFVAAGGVLVLAGALIATDLLRSPAGENPVEGFNNLIYFPLLVLQLILRIAALTTTSGTVGDEIRRNHWDTLRATEHGAELTLRSRWASVFYRLRGLLGVVLVLRLILIAMILWDLTAFQGRYLDLLTNGIIPDVPLPLAVLLLSFMMTAALLLPVTAVGFDASLGLMISSAAPSRTFNAMAQVLIILLRIGIPLGLSLAAAQFLQGQLIIPDDRAGLAWLLMFGLGALGDWGLAFLYLGRFGEIWATVPYGILFGLALLIFSLLQAALADVITTLAVRRSQNAG